MNAHPSLRSTLIFLSAVAAIAVQAACARSVDDGGVSGPGTFASENEKQTVCIETRCPAPYATCADSPGLCTVNLSNDVEHCGSCATPCPKTTRGTPWSWVCSEGECQMACEPFHADCNGLASDGCETATNSDPANCGACGNKCEDGVVCWKGACGCPNGFTQCGDECVNTQSDNLNCGACGSICKAPTDDADPRWTCGPGVTPEHTKWLCASASCDLQCEPGFGDCDHNFCGTGCEVFLGNDPANCGACGHACAAGQTCENGTCLCPPGTTRCGDACVDLMSDPNHCGGCGKECPGPFDDKGGPVCNGGVCSYVCFPGFANCDGRIGNGCEANLATSQKNCGSCGTRCDVARGQPCVEGVCLTKPCEDPILR
jgi:hypothetical protein